MMTEDDEQIRNRGVGADAPTTDPAPRSASPAAPADDDVDPLGPMPAAMFDDPDPLGPMPAAMYDDPDPFGPRPAAPPGSGGPATAAAGVSASSNSRNIAALSHLAAFAAFAGIPSFIGPLVVWLLERERDPFVEAHAREALNFNLSLLIYALVAIVGMVATLGLGLLVIVPVAVVAVPTWLVLTVMAAMKAADGREFRYPLTLRLVS